jgi:hypothetical protein
VMNIMLRPHYPLGEKSVVVIQIWLARSGEDRKTSCPCRNSDPGPSSSQPLLHRQ